MRPVATIAAPQRSITVPAVAGEQHGPPQRHAADDHAIAAPEARKHARATARGS